MSIHADICMNRFTLGSDFMYGHIKTTMTSGMGISLLPQLGGNNFVDDFITLVGILLIVIVFISQLKLSHYRKKY